MAVLPEKKGHFVKVEQGKAVLTLHSLKTDNAVARADSVWLSRTSDELVAQEYLCVLLYLGEMRKQNHVTLEVSSLCVFPSRPSGVMYIAETLR